MPLVYDPNTGQITEGPIPSGGTKVIALVDGLMQEVFVANNQVVADGDRDVSFPDSFDIADVLAGTLGPVFTQDSTDISDAVFQSLENFPDSFDTDDAADIEQLSATAFDSVQIGDQLQQVIQFVGENILATDDPVIGPLTLYDSLDTDDLADIEQLTATAFDSLDTDDLINATTITSTALDSWATSDLAVFGPLDIEESLAAADFRGDANLANATIYPNTVVSNTGFTNPANWADANPASVITLSASQSGGLGGGNSTTTNGDLIVSVGDVIFIPTQTVDSAQVEWTWTTSDTALLQTGNSVNVQLQYSLDEGGSWITFTTANTVGATSTSVLPITINPTQLNQLRFRAIGSVTSGSIALVGGATQNFTSGYVRLLFNATQVFP